MAGYPNISSVLIGRGTTGIYWSSSPSWIGNAFYYNINDIKSTYSSNQSYSLSVRCLKD
jgi:hypothetical protein